MKWIKYIAVFLVLLTTGSLLFYREASNTILRLINPVNGIYYNFAGQEGAFVDLPASLIGLKEKVSVQFDEKRIPHIFAQSEADIYFMQGYLTAAERLWQMSFYAQTAEGRLTEIVGEKALELDRFHRRIGIAKIAAAYLKGQNNKPQIKNMLEAYAQGVNAYISMLRKKDYPIEFKIFDHSPEPWTPYKSCLIAILMRQNQSFRTQDVQLTNALKKYGPAVMDDLFPNYPILSEPVIPKTQDWPFHPVLAPLPPNLTDGFDFLSHLPIYNAPEGIGSNNWAVHGDKTLSGAPILAGDPHLKLTLPSIWYQLQLQAPGLNVYGVSIPGLPGIIIGFNEAIAWSNTNSLTDVLDFYKIQFRDKRLQEYKFEDSWKEATWEEQKFQIKGQKKPIIDTLIYTHHGPVLYPKGQIPFSNEYPAGYAMKWMGNPEGEEFLAFYLLNRATNYSDFEQAIRHYKFSASNIAFASKEGDIAISCTGNYPLKWKGQGKYLLDGSKLADEWARWIPFEHRPHTLNPTRKYVSSANQFPVDSTYPYYLNWTFAPPERGIRINDQLASMDVVSLDKMQQLQNDLYDGEAARVLPFLLKELRITEGNESIKNALKQLKDWNYYSTAHSVAPSIFYTWKKILFEAIWEDDLPVKQLESPMRYPSANRTWKMIMEEADAPWFDNQNTHEKETLRQLLLQSFTQTIAELSTEYGELTRNNWAWHRVRPLQIKHLIPDLQPFSRLSVPLGGTSKTVNAIHENEVAASWKMVVSLENRPKARGIYPGGQSGNPLSKYYDDFIQDWERGELYELIFLDKLDTAEQRIVKTFHIEVEVGNINQ